MKIRLLVAAAAGLAVLAPVAASAATPAAQPQDFRAWLDQAIARNMTFPAALERSNVGGIAFVRFEVGADGRPADVTLLRSSGRAMIDRAALRAIATLDLPAGAPAGPHIAVLQYGSAADQAAVDAFSAELVTAQVDAVRALERERFVRSSSASLAARD